MTGRQRRRDRVGPHTPPTYAQASAALCHPIDLPIDAEEIRHIASDGFPYWEPIPVMVERNKRVTLGYFDLSVRLADLIANGSGVRDANWCTFATWSSRTIGGWIGSLRHTAGFWPDADATDHTGAGCAEAAERPLGERLTALLDRVLPHRAVARVVERSRAASFRALATGNRAVFLEVGLAVVTFLEHFPKRTAAGHPTERQWRACWADVQARLDVMSALDPSWLLTPNPPPDELRRGLHQYFLALRTDDEHLRSQHVLAGNILIGAYEQRRVDGYVWAAVALFTGPAMQKLVRDRTGAVGGVRRLPSRMFAGGITRIMTLQLGDEPLHIRRPIPPPSAECDHWTGLATNAEVTLPILQALITRYQLSIGRRPNQGARNWTRFDERMRTIGNLFRLRQRQAGLFAEPFGEEETELLLAGDGHPRPPDARSRAVGAEAGGGGVGPGAGGGGVGPGAGPGHDESDADLIASSVAEPLRFALVFDRHASSVFRQLVRRLGRADADALLPEVFRTAFEARSDFDPAWGGAEPWLQGIAADAIARHWRADPRRLGTGGAAA